ncbi:MAG: hypothetical protein ABI690_30490 [Chloroflexota bacterium]
MHFRKDEWIGSRWPSIDIEPMDQTLFFRVLIYLTVTYNFPMPRIIDTIDGYAADFEISDCIATLSIDAYMFSLAFQESEVRDQVLAGLLALPDTFFDDPENQASG